LASAGSTPKKQQPQHPNIPDIPTSSCKAGRKGPSPVSSHLLYHIPFIPFGWGLDTIQCDVAPESLLQDGGLTGACVAAVASPRPKMNVCRCQALYFVCNWLGQPLGLNRCLATGWLAGLLAGWRHLSPTVHHLPSTEAPPTLAAFGNQKAKDICKSFVSHVRSFLI